MKLSDKEFKRRMEKATRPVTLSEEEFNELANNPDKCKKIVAENRAMYNKLTKILMKGLKKMWDAER